MVTASLLHFQPCFSLLSRNPFQSISTGELICRIRKPGQRPLKNPDVNTRSSRTGEHFIRARSENN